MDAARASGVAIIFAERDWAEPVFAEPAFAESDLVARDWVESGLRWSSGPVRGRDRKAGGQPSSRQRRRRIAA